jgi:hypothetical protein
MAHRIHAGPSPDAGATRGAGAGPIYLAIGVLMCVSLLGFAVASCTATPGQVELAPRWLDAGTPQSSAAVERVTRYYVDETGTLWDDRGRKHDGNP